MRLDLSASNCAFAHGRIDSWLRIKSENAHISIQRVNNSSFRFILPNEKNPPTSQWIIGTPEKPSEKLAGMTHGMP